MRELKEYWWRVGLELIADAGGGFRNYGFTIDDDDLLFYTSDYACGTRCRASHTTKKTLV